MHNYLGIDLERIWQITQREVQQLKGALEIVLGDKDSSEQEGEGKNDEEGEQAG